MGEEIRLEAALRALAESQAERDITRATVHRLLTEMRRYVIHHGNGINECVAWRTLKTMFGVDESKGA